MIPSKGKKRHWGGGVMTPALRTLAPHRSWSIETDFYIPSKLSARHWALRVQIRYFWRTESKRWDKPLGNSCDNSKLAGLRYLLLHNPFRNFCCINYRKTVALANSICHHKHAGIRLLDYGADGVSRWSIERGSHRPRMKEILRQHHHARIWSRISAIALFVRPRSLGT